MAKEEGAPEPEPEATPTVGAFVRGLVALDKGLEAGGAAEAGGRPQKASAGQFVCTKFEGQLEALTQRLSSTNTHYVRCIAANKFKAHRFDLETARLRTERARARDGRAAG